MRSVAAQAGARPFLKWAGGKTQLLGEYQRLLPAMSGLATYHEPFVGSGAVFFHLRAQAAIPGRAVLSDLNPDLVLAWQAVRDQPLLLAARVQALGEKHSDDQYYAERERFNAADLDPLERAAVLIYLNKAGFNGLFRVNGKGHFNVPVGRRKSGTLGLPTAASLQACSRALQGVEILHSPFQGVLDRARPGDFAYFDPPYVPVSATSFTAYASEGFDSAEQELLRDVAVQLDQRGCKVMISNSGSFEVRKLYPKSFSIAEVLARRSINSKGAARGPVTEFVIRNYE